MGRGGARPNTGGARPGSGRKSPWQSSSKTKSIRVPEEIAAEVLGYAHRLDSQKATEKQIRQFIENMAKEMNTDPAFISVSDDLLKSASPDDLEGVGALIETMRRVSAGESLEIPTLDLRDKQIYLLGNKYVVCLEDLQEEYKLLVEPAKFTERREGESDLDIRRQFAISKPIAYLTSP